MTTTTITQLRKRGDIDGAWKMFLSACEFSQDRESHVGLREILFDHAVGRYEDQNPGADTSGFLGLDWLRHELAQNVEQLPDPATTAESQEHSSPELSPLWPLEYPEVRQRFETVDRAISRTLIKSEGGETRIHDQLEAMLHVATACWFYRHTTEPKSRSAYRTSHLREAMLRHLCQATRFYVAVHSAPAAPSVTVCDIEATPYIEQSASLDHVFERLGSLDPEDQRQAEFWGAAVASVRLLFSYLLPGRLKINHDLPRITNVLVLAETPNGNCPVCVTLEMSREQADMQRVCIPDPVTEGLRVVDESWTKTQRRLTRFMSRFGISGCFIWRIRFPDSHSAETLRQKYAKQVLGRSNILPGMLQRQMRLRGSSAGGAFATLFHLHRTEVFDAKSFVVIAGISAGGALRSVEKFEKLSSAPLVNAGLSDDESIDEQAGWIDHRAAFILDPSTDTVTREWVLHTLQCKLDICGDSPEVAAIVTGQTASQFRPPVRKPLEIRLPAPPERPRRPAARKRLRTSFGQLLRLTSGATRTTTAIMTGGITLTAILLFSVHLLSDEEGPPAPPAETPSLPTEVSVPLVRLNISSAVNHPLPTLRQLSIRLLNPRFRFMLDEQSFLALPNSIAESPDTAKFVLYLAEIHSGQFQGVGSEAVEQWQLRLKLDPQLHSIWYTARQEEEFKLPVGSVVDQQSILLRSSDRTVRAVILVFTGNSDNSTTPPELFLRPHPRSESP